MDAMTLTFAQEFGGYARQVELGIARVEAALVTGLLEGAECVGACWCGGGAAECLVKSVVRVPLSQMWVVMMVASLVTVAAAAKCPCMMAPMGVTA